MYLNAQPSRSIERASRAWRLSLPLKTRMTKLEAIGVVASTIAIFEAGYVTAVWRTKKQRKLAKMSLLLIESARYWALFTSSRSAVIRESSLQDTLFQCRW